MPVTPQSIFSDVFADLTKFLGVWDSNYPEGGEVRANSPYTKKFLQKRLVQADLEVCLLICSIEDHPYRNQFFTQEPTAINANSRIPAFLGVHGGIKIRTTLEGQTPEVWKDGDLAQSFDALKTARLKAKINKTLYGERRELYWIENGKIELIRPDLKAKVYVPTIPVQDVEAAGPGTLQLYTPVFYKNAPLAKCISQLNMKNTDNSHRKDFENLWLDYEQRIYGRALNLPLPERLQRIAG